VSAVPRYVAPSGAPIGVGDLARWVGRLLSADDPRVALRRQLSAALGVEHCFLTSTGRAGLTLILQALRDLTPGDRTEVVLPSYTCYSVAASIVKAGLTPRIADVRLDTLDYDPTSLAQLDTTRVVAMIATNLYGTPNDMPGLAAFARSRGIRLIDDAAQAFGAHVDGRPSGTWGDVGLYSFDKGKNVSAIDGGVIVTASADVAAAVARRTAGLPAPSFSDSASAIVKLAAYATLLRPSLYWIPNSIPQLGLGTTMYTTEFPLDAMSRSLAALASTMAPKGRAFMAARTERADAIRGRLESRSGLTFVARRARTAPACLRLPVLAENGALKVRLIEALNRAGIGATGSYPTSIADIPALAGTLQGATDCEGGRAVAERIFTLPTHPLVRPRDIDRLVNAIERVLGTAGSGLYAPLARPEAG
jgi:perosamine synthetase